MKRIPGRITMQAQELAQTHKCSLTFYKELSLVYPSHGIAVRKGLRAATALISDMELVQCKNPERLILDKVASMIAEVEEDELSI